MLVFLEILLRIVEDALQERLWDPVKQDGRAVGGLLVAGASGPACLPGTPEVTPAALLQRGWGVLGGIPQEDGAMAGGEEDGGQGAGNGEETDPGHGSDHGEGDALDRNADRESGVVKRQEGRLPEEGPDPFLSADQ